MNLSKDIHDMKGTLRDIIEADPMDIPTAHFNVQIAQVMACMLQNQLEAMRLIARYGGDAPRALALRSIVQLFAGKANKALLCGVRVARPPGSPGQLYGSDERSDDCLDAWYHV